MKTDRIRSQVIAVLSTMLISVLSGCAKSSPSDSEQVLESNESRDSDKLFGDVTLSDVNPKANRMDPMQPTGPHRDLHFTDVTKRSGIDFVYQTGAKGRSLMVETVGGGVGVFDFNRDGFPDVFLCQGGDPTVDDHSTRPPSAIYQNTSNGAFTEVWQSAANVAHGYAQGVAVGDFNADGFDDLYITCVGKNSLLENKGDGTFEDVTDLTNTGGNRWSTSAAFSDLTGDGLADLYVCNYLIFDPKKPLDCRNAKGEYRICHPRELDPWPDDFFVNRGDGTFEEQSVQRGLLGEGNKALGVATADFNSDGAADVYVANDTTANFLFINQKDGHFKELAMLLGCASNYEGLNQASMGLAIGDYDRNGWLDIYSTHFYEESNTLYKNLGKQGFQDVTGSVGLHTPTLQSLAFGTIMHDFDQNGFQDLFVTNGHVDNHPGNPILNMRPQMFSFDGIRWQDTSAETGDFFEEKRVGRGVASLDYDNDGDLDLLVVHQNRPAVLLQNDLLPKRWLKLAFIGRTSQRDGTGCRVTVHCGDASEFQELIGGGSYLSASEKVLVFGLPEGNGGCTVEVKWPSGLSQSLPLEALNQTIQLEEPLIP